MRSSGIKTLKQHIQHAAKQLEKQGDKQAAEGTGSLIYLGSHQDAIPRSLILDPHLESGEIHTWALLKIHISNPTLPSVIPTQNELMETLKCSRPVLSRHLQVLRALRWITLCAEVRGKDGQYRGHVYAQHDRPLNLQDTMYLDPDYIKFLEQPSTGPTLKRLRQIKNAVLRHIDYQVVEGIQLDQSPTYLRQISSQLTRLDDSDPLDTELACPAGTTLTNPITNLYTRVTGNPTANEAIRSNDNEIDHVKNFYLDNRVNVYMDEQHSSSSYIKTTTTYHHLKFPKSIDTDRLRSYAAKCLDGLTNDDQKQFALDYLADRIRAGEQGTDKVVGNPIGFLNWIVRNIQGGTLPESTYGVRDKAVKQHQTLQIDKKTRQKEETEAWIRSIQKLGFEIDPATGMAAKPTSVARGG